MFVVIKEIGTAYKTDINFIMTNKIIVNLQYVTLELRLICLITIL